MTPFLPIRAVEQSAKRNSCAFGATHDTSMQGVDSLQDYLAAAGNAR